MMKNIYLCSIDEKNIVLMIILESPISLSELAAMAENLYGDMVKAVADVGRNRLALDAELHSDLESELIAEGSRQEDLWGFNLYPSIEGEDFIEYDSLINIRPRQGNRSRDVEDAAVKAQIRRIVSEFIK